jgi:formylglycine-generating enzyme required for sulfatase activity
MLGNVEELCLDRKGGNKANAVRTPVSEPVGADSTSGNRIRKGGGFIRNNDLSIYWCRPGITSTGWSQDAANKCMGFRLCCPIMAP